MPRSTSAPLRQPAFLVRGLALAAATGAAGATILRAHGAGDGVGALIDFARLFLPLWVAWASVPLAVDPRTPALRMGAAALFFGFVPTAGAALHSGFRGFAWCLALHLGLSAWIVHRDRTLPHRPAQLLAVAAIAAFLAGLLPAPLHHLAIAGAVAIAATANVLAVRADPAAAGAEAPSFAIASLVAIYAGTAPWAMNGPPGFSAVSLLAAGALVASVLRGLALDVEGAPLRSPHGEAVVWHLAHAPLLFGLASAAVAAVAGAWQMTAMGTGIALAALAFLDSVTSPRGGTDRRRVQFRFALAAACLLGPRLVPDAAGAVAAVIVALFHARLSRSAARPQPSTDTAADKDAPSEISLAEHARARAAAQAAGQDAPAPLPTRPVDEAIRRGAPAALRRDLYLYFLEGSWTRLFASLTVLYLLTNVGFAGLYLLAPGAIVGGGSHPFLDAFFFSVQTMATIGYGGMTPKGDYANAIVTLEAAVGLLGVAVATGVIFQKVSRPRAGVLFSERMVLTQRNGRPALMFRVGNARGNDVVDASVSIAVLKDEITDEGHHLRRLYDLALVRARTPMFQLSWTIIHEIDGDSPLADVDWSDLDGQALMWIATLVGHDGTYAQTTYARHIYYPSHVDVGAHFVDVVSRTADGRLVVDYERFHDTESDTPPSA